MTRQPSTRAPRTAAGRNLSGLLRDARIYWPDNLTRIASTATDEWIAAIEAEAVAPAGLDVALHEVQCVLPSIAHMIGTPGFPCGDAPKIARLLRGKRDPEREPGQ